MATTKKHLRKIAAILESSDGVYEAPTTLLPFISGGPKQGFNMIEDESIVGVAFKGLPAQGVRKLDGNLEVDVDLATIAVLFDAAFGGSSGGVYSCPSTSNTKSLSLCALDQVKTNKYAGVRLNKFQMVSDSEGGLKASAELLSSVAEVRDDTAFPAMSVSPGSRVLHQHAGGTNGYIRIGDQGDALAAGDNQTIVKNLTWGIDWGFSLDYANAQGALVPQSARGEASLSFSLAEHSADTFMAWKDARTPLQLEAYYYISATKTLKIQVPNFVIPENALSEDAKARQEIKCEVARNGISTAYDNANMAFNTPIRATIVNT